VSDDQVQRKLDEVKLMFEISGDSPSDPIAKRPSDEQMLWSSKVAVAQEMLVREYDLDALSYYYHGAPGNEYEQLQSGFILGHSLLTAEGGTFPYRHFQWQTASARHGIVPWQTGKRHFGGGQSEKRAGHHTECNANRQWTSEADHQ
jgi:L-arabinose isomerase